MADLQRMLQKVVSSKKASARQKQAELIKVSLRLPCDAFGYTGSHCEASQLSLQAGDARLGPKLSI